jgi:hypothetical protein
VKTKEIKVRITNPEAIPAANILFTKTVAKIFAPKNRKN